ncbi:MAG: methyltransferase [Bacteroidales bacterium]|nr:methyltransferase [Bacteroidales bacterium]
MFHFKHFSLYHEHSTLKIGTDSVLLAAAVPLKPAHHVLDIGCGCGIIAYSLAWRLSAFKEEQHITGLDIDEASILEARHNLEIFPSYQGQHFLFEQCSVQQWAAHHPDSYDLIVTNPPYFGDSLKPDRADRQLSKHRDSTLSFSDLADIVCQLLSADGRFFLILPPEEMAQFHRELNSRLHRNFLMEITSTPGKPVSRIVAGYSRNKEEMIKQSLTIHSANGTFSEEYRRLTREFYL